MKKFKYMAGFIFTVMFGIFMTAQVWADTVPSSDETQSNLESESESQSEGQSESEKNDALNDILLLDDVNLYDGMSASYHQGYEPKIENHKVDIILPLYTQQEGPDHIQVIPDLGATQDSPFIYRNYQKTVWKTTESINGGGETKDVFLVRFELELQSDYYNGVYPVIFNVAYDWQNVRYEKAFTSYVQIVDGKSQTADETEVQIETPVEEKPTSDPKLIIEKCENMPEHIQSGDMFDVTVVVRNTNKQKYVQNMTITISSSTPDMTLQEDSNVLYFDYLGANQTLEIPLKFLCSKNMKAGLYSVSLDMSFDNPDAVSLTSAGSFDVEVTERMQVELEVGYFASEVNAGDSFVIPVQLMNLGKGNIYNARCTLEVPGLTADKSLFLGNVEGGVAVSGDMSVFAGMVNENAKNEEERYGKTKGQMKLIYEDENGEEYQVAQDIELNISPLKINASVPELMDDNAQKITPQLWIGAGIVVAIILIGSLTPFVIRKIQRKHTHE